MIPAVRGPARKGSNLRHLILKTEVPTSKTALTDTSVQLGVQHAVLNHGFGRQPLYLLLVGLVRGLVSIMVRVRSLQYTSNRDPWPFFGIFKLIVGAVFALFIFASINVALIPAIPLPEDNSTRYLFIALAFVAGFSERFAGDAISGVENRFGGSNLK